MRTALVCLVLLLASRPAWAQLPAVDFCTSDAAAITDNPNWTTTTETVGLIYTGAATCGGQAVNLIQAALWNAATFNDDQSSDAVLADVDTGHFIAVGVRMANGAGTDNFSGYYMFCGNATQPCNVQVCTDAAPSVCAVIGTYAEVASTGNPILLGVVGTRLYAYLNGVEILCTGGSGCAAGVLTDATHASGSAGLAAYHAGSVNSWGGGNFSITAGGIPVSSMSQLGAGR